MPNKISDSYYLVRLFYLKGLGFIYFLMALILYWQGPYLIGPEGIDPLQVRNQVLQNQGRWSEVFNSFPSLLFFDATMASIYGLSIVMLVGAILLLLGRANWVILLFLWICQLSLVNGGGRFYSFGWETMMLEMTWLCVFFVHPWRWNLYSNKQPVPHFFSFFPLIWMLFRLMLGAGLIKIRGDQCWLDLTCMTYHYQTQPNPHGLSWFYHNLPDCFHYLEVAMTHFYELIVPFFFLLIRPIRITGAVLTILFQLTLISTGNLAFLNWQTMVLCLVAFDDRFLIRVLPNFLRPDLSDLSIERPRRKNYVLTALGILLVTVLSYKPIANMISPQQRMNQSYDGLHLVNSYGLFGSITEQRYEIVISGSTDGENWQEYEFKCKPGRVDRRPCWITPYHLRLDWQMWFSAMRPQLQEQWLANLAIRMLQNKQYLESLLKHNPFAGKQAPIFLKMDRYEYRFTDWDSKNSEWWVRGARTVYLPVVKLSEKDQLVQVD